VHERDRPLDRLGRHRVHDHGWPRRLGHRAGDERHTESVRHEVPQPRQARRLEGDARGEARRGGVPVEDRAQPGARGKADERVGAQRGQAERGRARRRMVGRGDEHQLVGEQRRGDDARRNLGRRRAHGEVDAVVGEVVEQHPHTTGTEAELDGGVAVVERGEGTREVERIERLDRADAHPPDDDPRQAGEVGAGPVQLGQRAPGAGEEQLARVGEADVAGGAGEQGGAELGFELADLHRDGGLGNVQHRRGPAEPALAHDRVQVEELTQFHNGMLWV
jgi:hypothetical protein